MTRAEFAALAARGPVLLDGATGSNLRAAGMPVGVSPELWVLEHPEVLLDLQRSYVEAGSRILYAPTFSANRLALAGFGLEGRLVELNRRLVELSRQAAGGRALVAGDLTTTGQPLEPAGTMSYSSLYDIYREQIEVLASAGADLLVAETLLCVDEGAAALDAAGACGLPVICTLTVEADGAALYGGTAREAAETWQELGAAAVGVNCSVGPDQLESVVRSMAEVSRVPVAAKPNAGLPEMDEHGQAHYSMGPEEFVRAMARLREAGASLLGGCCGTTPEYIRRLCQYVGQAAGRSAALCEE